MSLEDGEKLKIIKGANEFLSAILDERRWDEVLPGVVDKRSLLRQRANRNEALNRYRKALAEELNQET